MRLIAADADPIALSLLTDCLRKACPQAQVTACSGLEEVLDRVRAGHGFDAAFLDVNHPDGGGEDRLLALRALCPRGNLIMVSRDGQNMPLAFHIHASGYLVKPVTVRDLQAELADLRYPVRPEGQLRVQTFGNFEVFYEGRPVHFHRSRSKELFAYLIDRRGAGSTMGELISVLWEGRPDTDSVRSQLRSLITDLRATLEDLGQGGIIIKQRDLIAVDPGKVECDYYRFLAGDRTGVNAFRGEYMANYSWGETTLGALEQDN